MRSLQFWAKMFREEVATAKPAASCVACSALPARAGGARSRTRRRTCRRAWADGCSCRPRRDRFRRIDEHRHLIDPAVGRAGDPLDDERHGLARVGRRRGRDSPAGLPGRSRRIGRPSSRYSKSNLVGALHWASGGGPSEGFEAFVLQIGTASPAAQRTRVRRSDGSDGHPHAHLTRRGRATRIVSILPRLETRDEALRSSRSGWYRERARDVGAVDVHPRRRRIGDARRDERIATRDQVRPVRDDLERLDTARGGGSPPPAEGSGQAPARTAVGPSCSLLPW